MRKTGFCSFRVFILLVGASLFLSVGPTFGAGWEYHQIDSYSSYAEGMSISVGTDALDKAHVSYIGSTGDHVYYATNKSGSWAKELIGNNGGYAPWANSIAVRSDGSVSIIYNTAISYIAYCKCKSNHAGLWATYDFGISSYVVSAAMGGDSRARGFLSDNMSGSLYFMKDIDPNGWTRLEPQNLVGSGQSTARGTGNSMHYCYQSETAVVYANDNSGTIIPEDIDWDPGPNTSVGIIGGNNLAIDSQGHAYIVFFYMTRDDYGEITARGVGLINNASGSWQFETVSGTDRNYFYTAIAIDLHDTIHVVYGGSGPGGIHYGSKPAGSGGIWRHDLIDANGMWGNDICTDSQNGIHVVYYRTMDAAVMYAYNPGVIYAPEIQVEPESVDFGDVNIDETQTHSVLVTNTGSADLWITGIQVIGDVDFTCASDCNTLPPEQSCFINVSFTPTAGGRQFATLIIDSNDVERPQVEVDLKGFGIPAATWVKRFGLLGQPNGGLDIIQTEDFGYILTGRYTGGINQYLPFIKLDMYGNIISQTIFGELAWDYGDTVIALADGNYLLGGMTFSYGNPSGYGNGWLVKVDPQGDALWSHTYGQDGLEVIHAAVECDDGDIVFCGERAMDSDNTTPHGWLARIDPNGATLRWGNMLGDHFSGLNDVIKTGTDQYAVAGLRRHLLMPELQYQEYMYLAIFNGNGVCQLGKLYQPTEVPVQNINIDGYSLVAVPGGGYLLAGYVNNGSHVDEWQALVVKVTDTGAIEWQKKYDGSLGIDNARSIILTKDGNYVFAGDTGGDGWLVKINPSGNVLWQKKYGGIQIDSFTKVIETRDGGFALTGYTLSYSQSDPIRDEIWVLKLDENGNAMGCDKEFIRAGSAIVSDANGIVMDDYGMLSGWTTILEEEILPQTGQLVTGTLCDGMCFVDMDHLADFAVQWLEDSGNPEADLDHNGRVNSEDFAILSGQWLAQCPEGWPWSW
jgi:hypothetical protein